MKVKVWAAHQYCSVNSAFCASRDGIVSMMMRVFLLKSKQVEIFMLHGVDIDFIIDTLFPCCFLSQLAELIV